MSKYVLSDLYKVAGGLTKVCKQITQDQLKIIQTTSKLIELPFLCNNVKAKCFCNVNTCDVKKSLQFVADRSYVIFKQTDKLTRKLLQSRLCKCNTKHLPNIQTSNVPPIYTQVRQFYSSSKLYDEQINYPIKPVIPSNTNKIGTKSSKLLTSSKQRRVPSSRISRIAGFGNLFLGLGIGAATEMAKRSVGFLDPNSNVKTKSNPFMSEANIERIVDTLCRMRGAALKLGQMLSIQDNSIVSPQVQKLFERVRQSADFMPTSQMYKVINTNLGPNWKDAVLEFEEKPFAAASIGQVHKAVLPDGQIVAMKIQYPGVEKSIETDISNIMLLLNQFDLLPRGLFPEQAILVAKRELHWECDYLREAEYAKKFENFVAIDKGLIVPKCIPELSASRVYTTEFFDGITLDQCVSLSQAVRNSIGERILRLCLNEVFVFRTMQTDPNWSNFLYCADIDKIVLLDFGASREYSKKFVDNYLRVIMAATTNDKNGIIKHSTALGFLSGYESKALIDAHVEAVNILGEAFASKEPFDFGLQSTTYRINKIIPVMLEHRLTPPPDESYSLHRKMSGCFLLCGKLKSVINCRSMFSEIVDNYKFN